MTEKNTMPRITNRRKGDDLMIEVYNTTPEEISVKISFPKTNHASTMFQLKPGKWVEAKRNIKGWACPPYKVEYAGRTFSGTSEREGFKN